MNALRQVTGSTNTKRATAAPWPRLCAGPRILVRGPLQRILLLTILFAYAAASAQGQSMPVDRAGRAINPNDVPRRIEEVLPDNADRSRAQAVTGAAQAAATGASPFLQLNDFRSMDGYNNNLDHPEWGQAGMPFARLTPPAYADGAGAPSGDRRPNARVISNLVTDQEASVPSRDSMSDFVWQWGQFLDHDIDLTPTADPVEPFDIAVPQGDPFFDPESTGTQTIPLNRSLSVLVDGVREQLNINTSYIDASQVYGSEETYARSMRMLDGTGRLKTSSGDLLPLNLDGDPDVPAGGLTSFFAGDVRAMEQVGLTAMHTLFLREHNYWADRIRQDVPELDDEGIYQRARAMVAAEMQCITYREFLPILLGKDAFGPYEGYQPGLNATISNEFATAAYRVGHTMLSPQLLRLDADMQSVDAGPLALRDAFFNPTALIDFGVEPYLRGLATQTAQEIDCYVIDDVRNFLFGLPGDGGFDLSSLNIQRGRDHGLPGYNDVRAAFGLPAATRFAAVSSDPVVQRRLRDVFVSVDDMDLWIAGLSEDHVPGAQVGETFWAILYDQFSALRDGDRYWYQHYLPRELQRQVEARDLLTIIRQNTDIGAELSGNVFVAGAVNATGSLRVRIDPDAAVANGAKWRVDGGAWHESGFEATHMSAGPHTVEFSEARGFLTPPRETVTIDAGAKSQMQATYLPLTPPAGCQAGTIDGGPLVPPADFLLLTIVMVMLAAKRGQIEERNPNWTA